MVQKVRLTYRQAVSNFPFRCSDMQLALKPPFWLLSLPLFIALYLNTASQPQGDGDECNLDDKRGDRDGDVEDKIVEGDLNCEDKIGDDLEDKRVDGEDKRNDVEGELFKTHHMFLVPSLIFRKEVLICT